MISRLQISDLHLGDPRSTLSNPEVAIRVIADIADLSNGHVTKLVVAGDAHEECVPGDMCNLVQGVAASVVNASSHFFGELFRKVKIDELVVVPGNHDLSAWAWYARANPSRSIITDYQGCRVPSGDWPWNFFYPGFEGREITFAYPIYWDTAVGGDYPMLVTTHGHLFDPLVLGWDPEHEYAELSALGCSRPRVSRDAGELTSVKQLAEITLPFCEQLWSRYSPLGYTYSNYIMRRLNHPQSCPWQTRFNPWGYYQLEQDDDQPPAGQGYVTNLPWFLQLLIQDLYLPTPVGTLRQGVPSPALTKPSCVTFGHDHLGTFSKLVACGVPFVAADSGGWTCEYDGHLPHAHALVWRKAGQVVPEPYFFKVRTDVGGLL
jgi:hypothetical protein